MQPTYSPINFKQIDMRKYHVRDLADAVKFTEFMISRLEEMRQVMRNSNNELGTLRNINAQLRSANVQKIVSVGAPEAVSEEAKVQVETIDKSVNQEHAALFEELTQDASQGLPEADEEVKEELNGLGDDENSRRTAEIESHNATFKITDGKNRLMFYINGKLVGKDKVPADTMELLLAAIGKEA